MKTEGTEGLEILLAPTAKTVCYTDRVRGALVAFSMKGADQQHIGRFLIDQLGLDPPSITNTKSLAEILEDETNVDAWVFSWLHSVQESANFRESLPAIAERLPVSKDTAHLKTVLSLNQVYLYLAALPEDKRVVALLNKAKEALSAGEGGQLESVCDEARELGRQIDDKRMKAFLWQVEMLRSFSSYGLPRKRGAGLISDFDKASRVQTELFLSTAQDLLLSRLRLS